MGEFLEVECAHIEDELMRLRFASSQLISDHPRKWGGTDTGPAPGDLVLMALTSASALAGRQFATQNKIDVAHIVARSSESSLSKGFAEELRDVALTQITFVEQFFRLLEIGGRLSDAERDALLEAMAENRVAKTIRNGVALIEEVIFHGPSAGRNESVGKKGCNLVLKDRRRLLPGETRVASAAENWRISASALDDQTCLVKAAGSMTVVGDKVGSQRGATPEELLLGGLAACTTIFLARNAPYHEIPLEAVRVRVRAQIPSNPREPITRIEKVAELVGEFTDQEAIKLRDFARFCAYGVTLSKATPIMDSVLSVEAEPSGAVSTLSQVFDCHAPIPIELVCSDQSCCAPTGAQRI